jgi:hypothetical protein
MRYNAVELASCSVMAGGMDAVREDRVVKLNDMGQVNLRVAN